MKLKEFEGKEIFRKYGITVPKGHLVKSMDDLKGIGLDECVIKAQVSFGGRGKAGLVKLSDRKNLAKDIEGMLGKEFKGETVKAVLIEERLPFDKQFYLSLTLDAFEKKMVCLFSTEGGVDIERVSATTPEKIVKFFVEGDESVSSGLKSHPEMVPIAMTLLKIMRETDAELVEINPLASVNGRLVALDSKVILDDNALFRHKEFLEMKKLQLNELERMAWEHDLHYVDLDGDVGAVGVGAGLVMGTIDLISLNGMRPAFFLDVGGGADTERMKCAMEIIDKRKPKKAFFNVFGGITRCDEIAQAIIEFKNERGIRIPLVIRMVGTNEKQAKEMLESNGMKFVDDMEEAVKMLKVM